MVVSKTQIAMEGGKLFLTLVLTPDVHVRLFSSLSSPFQLLLATNTTRDGLLPERDTGRKKNGGVRTT